MTVQRVLSTLIFSLILPFLHTLLCEDPLETSAFATLIAEVRLGNDEAFERLLDEYESVIRREIRFTLLDARLRQFVSDSDIYQSVVVRFMQGARADRFQLDSPEQLIQLFKGITKNRVAELVRYWYADRRNLGRNVKLLSNVLLDSHERDERGCEEAIPTLDSGFVWELLSDRDRYIIKSREKGLSWVEIATKLSARSSEAVRKSHERSLEKVAARVLAKREQS